MAKNGNPKKKADPSVAKKEKLKNRLQTLLYLFIIFASIAAIILFAVFVLDPLSIYRSAGKLADEGNYTLAIERYESLDGFFNSEKKIIEIQGLILKESAENGDYEAAVIAAENSGELEKYIAEMPEIFYEYAKSQAEKNPSVAKIYISYVLNYPGAKELYDEICLRNARQLGEMHRYSDVLLNFDAASSLTWLTTLDPDDAFDYAKDIARYSYVRAAKVLDVLQENNPDAKDLLAQLEPYFTYCGEKACVSDTADSESVNMINVFDFFTMDDTEYLIVTDGDIKSVYDASNNAFAKDTDGSYFAATDDFEAGIAYEYRFSLLENGTIQEKMTATAKDGTVNEYTRLWS
ncbi:MAG: hypothetical protein E7523_07905 [Ruminococcaceae bacterium]|nr:hypothetical protein [Oscillospiraceae bacterium]